MSQYQPGPFIALTLLQTNLSVNLSCKSIYPLAYNMSEQANHKSRNPRWGLQMSRLVLSFLKTQRYSTDCHLKQTKAAAPHLGEAGHRACLVLRRQLMDCQDTSTNGLAELWTSGGDFTNCVCWPQTAAGPRHSAHHLLMTLFNVTAWLQRRAVNTHAGIP